MKKLSVFIMAAALTGLFELAIAKSNHHMVDINTFIGQAQIRPTQAQILLHLQTQALPRPQILPHHQSQAANKSLDNFIVNNKWPGSNIRSFFY